MPLIEANLVTRYPAESFQVLVAHSFPSGQDAAYHVQLFGLSFPVFLDFESELFRRYRIPGHVFPLNAVIDTDGRVAHIGTVLDEATAVLDGLLLP